MIGCKMVIAMATSPIPIRGEEEAKTIVIVGWVRVKSDGFGYGNKAVKRFWGMK